MGKKKLSVIDVMFVALVALVIAAVAVPNIIRSRKKDNEKWSIMVLHTVYIACESFKSDSGKGMYPNSLTDITGPDYPDLSQFFPDGAQRHGYRFVYSRTKDGFECWAYPLKPGLAADTTFYVNQKGVVKLNGPEGEQVG